MVVYGKGVVDTLRTVRQEFFRFLVVGGLAAIVHWGILTLGILVFSLEGTISTTLGFVVASAVSYILNYFWTFNSEANHGTAIVKFMVVAGLGLILNATIFATVKYGLNTHFLLAQAVATGLVLFWNFSLYRIWSFRA